MHSASFKDEAQITPVGGGKYKLMIDQRWFGPVAPNGGYLINLIVRAIAQEIADESRRPRTITVHFLAGPSAGPAEIAVWIERAGRSLSSVRFHMSQAGKPIAIGVAAFSVDFPEVEELQDPHPQWQAPAEVERPEIPIPPAPPVFGNVELRPTLGSVPFSGGPAAECGGWARMDPPEQLDEGIICLLADVWWPALFSKTTQPAYAPTVEMTIHFRAPLPTDPQAYVYCQFETHTASNGFVEEDGWLWAEDGRLIAQSRQLALLRPMPERKLKVENSELTK